MAGLRISQTLTISGASNTALAALQTLVGAGNLTLVASTVTLPNQGQRPTLTSTGNLSGVNFTFYGTSIGNAQTSFTSTIAGPNNNTVSAGVGFATITRIAADAAVGTNVSAGYAATGETPTWPCDVRMNPFSIGFAVVVPSAGVTYTVQFTEDDVFVSNYNPDATVWFNHPSMTALVASATANFGKSVTAFRVYGTGAGTIYVRGNQSIGLIGR